jgi:hypothetical protein
VGKWRIASSIVAKVLYESEWVASGSGYFIPGEKALDTHSLAGGVGLSIGLDLRDFMFRPRSRRKLCPAGILCSVQRQLCSVQRQLCSVQRQLCSVQRQLCNVQRQLCSVQWQLCNVQRQLCSLQRNCVLYSGNSLPKFRDIFKDKKSQFFYPWRRNR